MRKKFKILWIIALNVIVIFIYLVFFLLRIDNFPLFLFLTIGSVAIISTSTIYTVVQSESNYNFKIGKKKFIPKPKSIKKKTSDLIEDYIDAMPLIEKYVESDESYESMEAINDYIFSIFDPEELEKIDRLDLSKMDKIFFIREMLYFEAEERKILIEEMLKNKDKSDKQIIYNPPKKPIKMRDKIRVYIRSLLEPGEKTKIIILETNQLISLIKEKVGILFDYDLEDFLLSSGGILLDENFQIKDYDIDDDDEIALIPLRKEKN